jgi:hypothetical protein
MEIKAASCKMCGRVLKDKRSIERAAGPVCYKKLVAARESEDKENGN